MTTIRKKIADLLIAIAMMLRGYRPIAGGAAPGQDAGGAGGAPAGAAGGTPPGQGAPAGAGDEDPFGFNQHLEGADPTVRPYLERVFGELGPRLQERIGQVPEQFAPLQPFMDRIGPLLETPEGGDAPVLAGLLDFYEMTGDEARLEEFADWFDRVGEEYGFFGDDDEGGEGGDPGEGDPDPNSVEGRLARLEQENQALRGELQQGQQQTAVQRQQQTFQQQRDTLMQENGIVDPEGVPDEQKPSTIITRLASSYVDSGDVDTAMENAVRDYMTITGQSAGQLVRNAGEATAPVDNPLLDVAHTGGRRPGAALGGGSPDTEPEAVHSWQDAKRIALSRLQASG